MRRDHPALQEQQGRRDQREPQDQLVQRAVQSDRQEPPAQQEQQGRREQREPPAQQEQQGRREQREPPAQQEQQGRREQREPLAQQEQQGRREQRELPAQQEQQGRREQREPLAQQEQQGEYWDLQIFFALMPPDNAATVAPGTDVSFPQNGPTSGTTITRTGPSSFNLAAIGTYQVLSQVSVTEAGQLILTLNGADLAYTVVGRATGTSQIVEMAIVQTTVINSILTVRNPAGNSTALTITPLAGGTRPVSAHLVITQLA
ncbi:hypothetical protein [Paenibacillus sp. RC343]|uniref:hypothetical protein n=1 Tax=Paenibacillus sp. RC343 TaxID=3045841 RepID=UPI0024B950DB|nr:hypothetical protein [Paenibacillus sp. RC343]